VPLLSDFALDLHVSSPLWSVSNAADTGSESGEMATPPPFARQLYDAVAFTCCSKVGDDEIALRLLADPDLGPAAQRASPLLRFAIPPGGAQVDIDRMVVMTAATMAQEGLVHGCFVMLSATAVPAPSAAAAGAGMKAIPLTAPNPAVAQVCCIPDDAACAVAAGTVLLSRALHTGRRLRGTCAWLPPPNGVLRVWVTRVKPPPVACRVFVARVATAPAASATAHGTVAMADAALTAYFGGPERHNRPLSRLLQVGQLLHLPADRLGEVAGLAFSPGLQRLEPGRHDGGGIGDSIEGTAMTQTVSFRVSLLQLEGEAEAGPPAVAVPATASGEPDSTSGEPMAAARYALAVQGQTSLLQEGVVLCAIPAAASILGCGCTAVCCAGLVQERRRVKEQLLAFLQPDRSDRTPPPLLLLQGPAGTGRSRLVASVAAELGLHLCDYACGTMASDVAGRTRARLADAFAVARACPPSVLLLRDVDALAGVADSPAAISQAEQTAELLLALARGEQSPLQPHPPDKRKEGKKKQAQAPPRGDGGSGGGGDGIMDRCIVFCGGRVIVVGTTTAGSSGKRPAVLGGFANDLKVPTLDAAQRLAVLECATAGGPRTSLDVDLAAVAEDTAGLRRQDLRRLLRAAGMTQVGAVERHAWRAEAVSAGVQLGHGAVMDALEVSSPASSPCPTST